MATLTRPERTVASIARALEDKDEVWRRRTTLLRSCQYKAWSRQRRELLQQLLVEEGIYPRPRLTDEAEDTERIVFSRRPYVQFTPGLSFASEKELESFIFENYRTIPPLSNLKSAKRQRLIGNARVGLLFREKRTNDYVVCEVESGDGRYDVAGQLGHYLAAFQRRAEAEGVGLRGIVISGAPSEHRETELQAVARDLQVRIDWYCHQVTMDLVPVFTSEGPLQNP